MKQPPDSQHFVSSGRNSQSLMKHALMFPLHHTVPKVFRSTYLTIVAYFHFFSLFNFFLMNIFVAKLNFNTQSDDLRETFEAYGMVDSAKVIVDHFTGKSKGFGFVEMPNDDEAMNAIKDLDNTELDGNTIVVKKAEPRENRSSGGGGFNRGGGGDRRGGGGYGGGGNDRGGYGGGGGYRNRY